VFPMVNNFDGTDWVNVADFLNDPEARALFRQQVSHVFGDGRYKGLMFDLESFAKAGQPATWTYCRNLSLTCTRRG
jgi:hypothetical protein